MRRPLAAVTAALLLATPLSLPLTTLGSASAAPASPGSPASTQTASSTEQGTPNGETLLSLGSGKGRETYIVQMSSTAVGGRSAEKARGRKAPSASTQRSRVRSEQASTRTRMQRALGRAPKVGATWTEALNGFSVSLTAAEAKKVAALDGVTAVTVETYAELDTDRGPTAIGAPSAWDGSGLASGTGDGTSTAAGTRGEGVVIGIVDSGITIDHPSFAARLDPDEGGDGYQHVNPLGSGTYLGMCDPDSEAYDERATCNDKVIGQWKFTLESGAPESIGDDPGVGDSSGHGTHVAATAAGNRIDLSPATLTQGGDPMVVSGVAPHATVITYDVCANKCPDTALLAGLEQALADGVDVVNYSISANDGWSGPVSVAFRNLRAAGIHVARSAGNSGPNPSSTNIAQSLPWTTSVAGTQIPRVFRTQLRVDGGRSLTLDAEGGAGLSMLGPVEAKLARALTRDPNCLDDFAVAPDADEATRAAVATRLAAARAVYEGKIVACQRGGGDRVVKSANVKKAGAVGLVLYNATDAESTDNNDQHVLPSVQITRAQGANLLNIMTANPAATARIGDTYGVETARTTPHMFRLSSRGPVTTAPVAGPSLAAPGENVLSADGRNGNPFQLMSGTSMASPHVAGTYALLASLHPDWTPAQMQSAAMTTADPNILEHDGSTRVSQFDAGSGLVNVTRAANAGILLDEDVAAYAAADPASGGDPRTLNLASLVDDACVGACSWTRQLGATDLGAGTWTVTVEDGDGMTVEAPSTLALTEGSETALTVDVTLNDTVKSGQWRHGAVVLTPPAGSQASTVRLPVSAKLRLSDMSPVTVATARDAGATTVPALLRQGSTVTVQGLSRGAAATGTVSRGSSSTPVPTRELSIHTLDVPAGTARVVATLESDAKDLELYAANTSPTGTVNKCESVSPTSAERCSITAPTPGTWHVGVHGYDISPYTDQAPYTLRLTAVLADGTSLTGTYTAPGTTTGTATGTVRVAWDEDEMQPGETWYGAVTTTSATGDRTVVPVDVTRTADDVTHTTSPATVTAGEPITHTVTLTPQASDAAQTYTFSTSPASGTTYLDGLESAGATQLAGTLTWSHEVPAGSTTPKTFTYRTSTSPTVPDGTTLTDAVTHTTTLDGATPARTSATTGVVWPAAPTATPRNSSGPGIRNTTVTLTGGQSLALVDADGDPATSLAVTGGAYSVAGGVLTFTPDADFHGSPDPATYRITDPHGRTSEAAFTVTVFAAAPGATDLVSRGHGAQDVEVPVTSWQSVTLLDADGDPVAAGSVAVTGGTYSLAGAVITFTPDAGFHGEAAPVTYRVSDTYGQDASAVFTATVLPPAPTAPTFGPLVSAGHGPRTATVSLSSWQTLSLLDTDGNPAPTVTVNGGTYSVDGSVLTFTPDADFHGQPAPLTWRVSDLYGQRLDETFTPTVWPAAPTAGPVTARGVGTVQADVELASWQSLFLGSAAAPVRTTTTAEGTFTVNGSRLTFVPGAGFHGTTAALPYVITDLYGQSATGTVTITSMPPAPAAEDLTSRGHGTRTVVLTTTAWQELTLLDADGDPATRVAVDGGAYSLAGDVITFTPDAGFHGEAAPVTYRIEDVYAQDATSTFTATVFAAAPTATDLTERGRGRLSVSVATETWQTLRLLDAGGDPVAPTGTVSVTGGTYSLAGNTIAFTPDDEFHGEADPVTYRVRDTYGQEASATFTPTVLAPAPNPADRDTRDRGEQRILVSVKAWQQLSLLDADGDPVAPTDTVAVTGGTYSLAGNAVVFTPDAGFHGDADPITFRVSDVYGQSDTATWTPTVLTEVPGADDLTSRGPGARTVAVPITTWQTLRLLDADGDPVAPADTVAVTGGTYSLAGDEITFTPEAGFHGDATPVTYRISDPYAQVATATFTPTVFAAAPAASDLTERGRGPVSVSVATEAWQTLRLLDAGGDPVAPAGTVSVTGGTYSLAGDVITFTPDAGFHGEAAPVSYRISDPYGQSARATFTPTVLAAAPVATDLTSAGHGARTVTVPLASWQTLRLLDADGNPATRVSVFEGVYTLDGDEITFTPGNFHGTARPVTYRVSDGYGQQASAKFSPRVFAEEPVATDRTSRGHGAQEIRVAIELWQQVTLLDADGEPTTRVSVAGGTYVIDGLTVSFTPDAGFHGEAAPVTYRISDNYGQDDTATWTPTVMAAAPSVDDLVSRGEGQPSVRVPTEAWQQLTLVDGTDEATTLRVPEGTYSVDGGTVTFTPEIGFLGVASPVTYRVSDVYGQSDEATWTPTVIPSAPAAQTLTSSGQGAQQVLPALMPWQSLTLLDADGDPAVSVQVTGGTYTLQAPGTLVFTPDAGFVGEAAPVSFRVGDGFGQSALSSWTPTVTAVPAPPAPSPDGLTGALSVKEKAGVVRSSFHRASAPSKLTTRCVPSAGRVERCSVTLTATVKGRTVTVGKGSADGASVVVKLTKRGRALTSRPGGVRVKASMTLRTGAGTDAGSTATDTKRFTLVGKRFTVTRGVKFSSAGTKVSKKDAKWLRSVRARSGAAKTVVCIGYTDSVGDARENKALSRARAVAVCSALALPSSVKVVVKGAGEAKPVASNATARGRAANRRVEITLVH